MFIPFRLKERFIVTSSQDCTIKIWNIPESLTSKAKAALISCPETLHAKVTERGHNKVMLHLILEHAFSAYISSSCVALCIYYLSNSCSKGLNCFVLSVCLP